MTTPDLGAAESAIFALCILAIIYLTAPRSWREPEPDPDPDETMRRARLRQQWSDREIVCAAADRDS